MPGGHLAATCRPAGGLAAAAAEHSRPLLLAAAEHTRPLLLLGVIVGLAYAPQLIAGTTQFDGVDVHYSTQRYLSDALHAGQLPFWTPYVFAGFPFLADVQVGAWYPLNWPFFVAGIVPGSISGELLLHALIACGGTYALAIRWIGQPAAAVAAALFYGLSGYFAAHSQHVGMVETAAWLPWLILLLDALGERLSLRRLALGGLLGAALALPGHFQTALYAFSGASLWAFLDALSRRDAARGRRLAMGVLVVGVWGTLLAAIMILPGLELVAQSVRTRLNAFDTDIGYFHPDSLLTLVQPDYYGLLSGHYTGPGDSTQHYFYAGILLVPLALLGLGHTHARRAALWLGVPFLWYALGPAGGLFRLVARLPGFRSIELPMHGWFLPALGLALLGSAGVLKLQLRLRNIWRWTAWGLIAVLAADLIVVNELLNPLAFARHSFDELYGSAVRSFDAQLDALQAPVQRLDGPPLSAIGYRNHALQSYVETTYGYNPLELAAYADYVEAAQTNPRLLDGLAATHELEASAGGGLTIRPRPSALPLAYFAAQLTAVPDETAAAAKLADLDPARETVVVGPPPAVQPDPAASASIVARGADAIVVHYRAATSGVLRLAIPFFPGWQASLNAEPLATLRVDHALLGVVVPAGEGDVRVWYAPRLFWLGAAISGLALLAVVAALLGRRR